MHIINTDSWCTDCVHTKWTSAQEYGNTVAFMQCTNKESAIYEQNCMLCDSCQYYKRKEKSELLKGIIKVTRKPMHNPTNTAEDTDLAIQDVECSIREIASVSEDITELVESSGKFSNFKEVEKMVHVIVEKAVKTMITTSKLAEAEKNKPPQIVVNWEKKEGE